MGCRKKLAINFVVAHGHEARPFIDYYGLQKDRQHTGYTVFENNQIRLILSGQGRINAAAATAYLGGISSKDAGPILWVNAGIAGHPNHRVGSLWRVNKITDEYSGRSIYPVRLRHANRNHTDIPGCGLITVAAPASKYAECALVDMEAAGFFQTAVRFATLETIASFKVVSDNLQQPLSEINRAQVADMITAQVSTIDTYLHDTNLLINFKELQQTIEINDIRLTFSQKKIINELIVSLRVHGSDYSAILSECKDAGQLINSLRAKLKSVELLV